MKNRTKFLDDVMSNHTQRNIVIDVTNKPPFEDWWRFEEECLGEHFGMTKEDGVEWWGNWANKKEADNFVMLRVSIKDDTYEVIYKTGVKKIWYFADHVDLVISFSDIYNTYLLKPLPETLGENKDKNVHSDIELTLEEQLKEALEEIEALNSIIKDMGEIIKRYEHNLTFVWAMLEQNIKESK